MQLRSYLARHGIGVPAFARQIAVSPISVYRWLRGERMPRPDLLLAIRTATHGAVTADDFLDLGAGAGRLKSPASAPPAGPAPSRRAAAA